MNTTNEDLLDDDLQAVMGPGRCQNLEDWQPKPKKTPEPKPATYWEPPRPTPNQMDRLKAAAKGSMLYGALCLLFFYWQQTGLMDPKAAMPCMLTCMLLTGLNIGKNALK